VEVYDLLFEYFGPQGWWPASTSLEVIVGAILTQNTSWHNVEKAILNLKEAGLLSLEGLLGVAPDDLAELIRPSGYYNVKARKLKAMVSFLQDNCQGDLDVLFARPLDELRRDLLSVYGVGPETADSILLYAGGLPSFVVDAYTRRVFQRLSLVSEGDSYEDIRGFFMERLPSSPQLYNEYHALIVALAKDICTVRNPKCNICPLNSLCSFHVLA
jgi:endonuclease-3 related protein